MSFEEDIEESSFLDRIRDKYGYDFSGYSKASLKRRIKFACERSGKQSLSGLLDCILRDPGFFRTFLSDLMVNVTEMFRDPNVYLVIRREVLPILRTYPSIKIWHAGCSTGEEVYSMAILLKEAGLYEKSLLYATDVSPRAIETAKAGIYSASQIKMYTNSYQKSGGIESFANYCTAKYDSVKFLSSLRQNIIFSQHNLVTDEVFSEIHLVLCRNVLIYFGRSLQERVLSLLYRSLTRRGFLCLGNKESLELSEQKSLYEIFKKDERIYRKI